MWMLAGWRSRMEARREMIEAQVAPPPVVVAAKPGDRTLVRAAKRWPHLLPANRSFEAFEAWLAEHGEEVDGPLEALGLYADICELAGWDDEAEPAPEADPPRAIASEAVPVALPAPEIDASLPTNREVAAQRAAERFVEWLRIHGHTGEIKSQRLADLYRDHIHDQDVPAIADNTLRRALISLPGVRKGVPTRGTSAGNGRHGYRPTVWIIEPGTVAFDEIPFDLPERGRAAA